MKKQLLAGALAVAFGTTMMASGAMAFGHDGAEHGGMHRSAGVHTGMAGIRNSHAEMRPNGMARHHGLRRIGSGYGDAGSYGAYAYDGGYYGGPGLIGPDLGWANGYDICPPGYSPYGNCSSLNTIGW